MVIRECMKRLDRRWIFWKWVPASGSLMSRETKSVRNEWLCLQPSLSFFSPCITQCPVTLFAHKSLVSDQMRYHPVDIFAFNHSVVSDSALSTMGSQGHRECLAKHPTPKSDKKKREIFSTKQPFTETQWSCSRQSQSPECRWGQTP